MNDSSEKARTANPLLRLQYTLILLACIVMTLMVPMSSTADNRNGSAPEALLEMNFEGSSPFSFSPYEIENHGGKIIRDGIRGKALRLDKSSYLTMKPGSIMAQKAGTVIFWVRPHWNYYDRIGSSFVPHTFMSFRWDSATKGYFIISDGWWEPKGALKTYFIVDNQQHAYTVCQEKYLNHNWVQLACSWNSATGSIKIFFDGKLRFETNKIFTISGTADQIFIGCDKGAPMSAGRWADCDMDELSFYGRELSARDIEKLYSTHDPDPQARYLAFLKHSLNSYNKPKGKLLSREMRAIFDEGTGWMTPSGALETIKRIKLAGFNVYIPCVWHGRGTRYPSLAAVYEEKLDFYDGDPLFRLITIAHANGIEVHPSFCVALRQRDFYPDYYASETPLKAFDLQRPGFRKFIADLIIEVVKRYDIDGINLDYLRTMGICTCSFCRENYRRRYGRDLSNDINQKKSDGALEHHLQKWIDHTVTSIVSDVSVRARKSRPNVTISVDGHSIPSYLPPSREGRNEVMWANAGLIDLIFNMDYAARPDFECNELVRRELKKPQQLLPALGNYDLKQGKPIPRSAELLNGIIGYARNRWGNGFFVYDYSFLSNEQINSLHQTINDN